MVAVPLRSDRISLTTLRLIVAVAEEGVLTRAATREGIAPSAASKRLLDLETDLDVVLFERAASGMRLTPAGESMLQHARRVLIASSSLIAELGEYRLGVRGHVRMLSNLSTIVGPLPGDLKWFFDANPDLRISLEERPSSGVAKGVGEGYAEVGTCSSEVDLRDVDAFPYRRDRLVVMMRPDHALFGQGPLSFADALDHDHIGLHRESSIFRRCERAAREAGKPLRLRIHVPGFDAICRTVHAGLGVAIVPEPVFHILGKPMGLHAESLTDSWAARELVVVISKDRVLSPAAALLRDHLHASASKPS